MSSARLPIRQFTDNLESTNHMDESANQFENIIEGVQEFQTEVFQHKRELFASLEAGQRPHALFVTCSDSRISPGMITQTEPGDLFIMRNAGNIIPPYGAANGGEGATIEYAVLALDIPHIIVCGHSHCGAMKGLLHSEELTDMPSVSRWLRHAEATRLMMRENYSHLPEDEKQTQAARENVLMQIENLQTHPAVAVRLAQRRLKLHAWMYHFETGEVFSYEPTLQKFVPVSDPIPGVGRFQSLLPVSGVASPAPLPASENAPVSSGDAGPTRQEFSTP